MEKMEMTKGGLKIYRAAKIAAAEKAGFSAEDAADPIFWKDGEKAVLKHGSLSDQKVIVFNRLLEAPNFGYFPEDLHLLRYALRAMTPSQIAEYGAGEFFAALEKGDFRRARILARFGARMPVYWRAADFTGRAAKIAARFPYPVYRGEEE